MNTSIKGIIQQAETIQKTITSLTPENANDEENTLLREIEIKTSVKLMKDFILEIEDEFIRPSLLKPVKKDEQKASRIADNLLRAVIRKKLEKDAKPYLTDEL